MKTRSKIILSILIVAFVSWPLFAKADPRTDQAAIDLIDEMEAIYRGDASHATLSMIVSSPQYQRTMRMKSSNLGTEHSFIRILSPKKDKGITTLKRGEEMWNYFPKINKVIKVPPSMMMGSWMGSDFTNDDLVKQTTLTEQYSLSLSETDSLYTITLIPKAQTVTVWGKIDYIINKEFMVPQAQNFYDDKFKLIRTLSFKEIKDFSGRMIPSKLEMIPLNKTGHKTTIIYEKLEFNPADINESTFSLRNLKRRS